MYYHCPKHKVKVTYQEPLKIASFIYCNFLHDTKNIKIKNRT